MLRHRGGTRYGTGPYTPRSFYLAGMEGMGMEGSLTTFFSEGDLVDPQLRAPASTPISLTLSILYAGWWE